MDDAIELGQDAAGKPATGSSKDGQSKSAILELWVPIIVAIITVAGSIFGIYLKSAVDKNSQSIETLRIVDYQVGETEMGEVPDPTTWLLGKPSEAHPDRRATKHVIFGHTFDTPPQVVAAIKALDAAGDDAKGDLRINTWADNITREGFDLNVQTWNRSLVHDVDLSWTAVELRGSSK